MKGLKQSTVATVIVGPVLDANGAAVTTAVVGDFRIAKNGTVATLSGATVTHDANGFYTIALTTGNTDTTGRLVITSGNTSHSMASHHWSVLPASVFDAIYTNATNSSGGFATATGTISALAGAIATTTNITSASGIVLAAQTHTGATIPTVTSVTNGVTVSDKTGFSLASNGLASVTAWTVAITGNITGNLSGSVGSVTSAVTVGTNNDKTGYSLSQAFPTNFASLAITAGGAVTAGTVSDKTGYSLTQAFPSNFASLGINASGHISRVTLVDTTTTNTDMRGTDGAALASAWTATRAGYLDGVLIAANYNQRTVSVTGSNHVAADIHELQPAVIDSTHFAANWFTAAGLATDAVAEIADGVWDEILSGHLTVNTTGKALSDSGSAGNPWTTDLATGYSGTQAGNILNSVKSQTDLIQAGGTVTVSTPVTATGQITTPLIIGDDYLNANGRAFSWTVPLPSGYVIATASCKFGMRFEDSEGVNSFIATGTLIDAGSGNVTLRFDVPRTTTGELRPGWYDWSVEIVSASGTEITRVKSGKNAEWQAKQT